MSPKSYGKAIEGKGANSILGHILCVEDVVRRVQEADEGPGIAV